MVPSSSSPLLSQVGSTVLTSCSVRNLFLTETISLVSDCETPGEVVEGMDLVKKIETHGSQSGKTSKPIVIANCGTV